MSSSPQPVASSKVYHISHSNGTERDLFIPQRPGGLEAGGSERRAMYSTLARREFKHAEILAREYLQKSPASVDGLQVLTVSLALQRRYNLAGYYASVWLKNHGANTVSLNILGLAALKRSQRTIEDINQAVEYFNRALELSSREVAAALNLGYLALDMGRYPRAMRHFRDASRRCSNCSEARLGVSHSLVVAGRFKEAEGVLEDLIVSNPSDLRPRFQLALIYWGQRKSLRTAERLLRGILRQEVKGDAFRSTAPLKNQARRLLTRIEYYRLDH